MKMKRMGDEFVCVFSIDEIVVIKALSQNVNMGHHAWESKNIKICQCLNKDVPDVVLNNDDWISGLPPALKANAYPTLAAASDNLHGYNEAEEFDGEDEAYD